MVDYDGKPEQLQDRSWLVAAPLGCDIAVA
jgi:hypothetical protein